MSLLPHTDTGVGSSGNYTYALIFNVVNVGQTSHDIYGWNGTQFIPVADMVSGLGLGQFIDDINLTFENREFGAIYPGPRFSSWTLDQVAFSINGSTDKHLDLDHTSANATDSVGIFPAAPAGIVLIRWVTADNGIGAIIVGLGNANNMNYTTDTNISVQQNVKDAITSLSPNLCIHPMMIVDELNIPIKDVIEYRGATDYIDNMKIGHTNKFINIKKDSLGENIPSKDLLLTKGHPIIFNGKEIECEKLVNGETIVFVELEEYVTVHALLFHNRKSIRMHNVEVLQWSKSDFDEFLLKHNCKYTGNEVIRS